MLPVYPDAVIVHRRKISAYGDGAETGIVPEERRDLALVSISERLTGSVGLEKRRGSIGGHTLGWDAVCGSTLGAHCVSMYAAGDKK
jgi:hypothetical protein